MSEVGLEMPRTDQVIPKKGLWNPKTFVICGVIFSCVPVFILFLINYSRLKLYKSRNIAFILITAIIIIMYLLVYMFAGSLSQIIFSLVNLALSIYFMKSQQELYNEHMKAGGKKASIFIPVVLYSIAFLVVAIMMISSVNIPRNFLRIGEDRLYYTQNVSKNEATRLGDYLEDAHIFSKDGRIISFKVDQNEEYYSFYIIVDESQLEDPELNRWAKDLAGYISRDIFEDKKVIAKFTDRTFTMLKALRD